MILKSVPVYLVRRFFRKLNRWYAVRDGVVTSGDLHIGPGTTLWAPRRLEIGSNVYIGKRCTIEVDGSIGSGSMIANNVGLVGRHDHDYRAIGLTIRDAPWVGDADFFENHDASPLHIGSDVWIGFGAIVLSGISIGRGAVVAAGSVVTDDVEPYAIVAGVPARQIGRRFNDDQIAQHEQLLDTKRSGRVRRI